LRVPPLQVLPQSEVEKHVWPFRGPPLQAVPQSEVEKQVWLFRGPPLHAVPQSEVEKQVWLLRGPPLQAVPQSEVEKQVWPFLGPPLQVAAKAGEQARVRRVAKARESGTRVMRHLLSYSISASMFSASHQAGLELGPQASKR
jgi:hypothetical protein